MNLVKEYCEAFRQTWGPFFPTPKKKREAFLEKVREKVEYYQPKIEAKCNVALGNVNVRDNKEFLNDLLSPERANRRAMEIAWFHGRVPTTRDYLITYGTSSLIRAIMTIPLWILDNILCPELRYADNAIYVPFYSANKFMDVDFERRIKKLDRAVIHELSHCLWHKTLGNTNNVNVDGFGDLPRYRKWNEGFATYCESTHFSDVYPEGTKELRYPKSYVNGKKKIEELVKKHGKEILLEVPKRWKEFDKELELKQI